MSGHDARHEVLLAEWLAGDDPRRRLAGSSQTGCEECVRILEESLEVEERIAGTARALSEAVDSAATAVPDARSDTFEAWLGKRLGETGPAPSRPVVRAAIAVAAAVLVILVLVRWSAGDAGSERGGVLGPGDALELVAPSAPVESWATTRFAWRGSAPRGGWLELVVRGERGEELARVDVTGREEWTPDAADVEGWPAAVVIELRALSAVGDVLAARSLRLGRRGL